MQILPHSTKNIIAKTQSSFQHDIGPKLPLSTVTDLSLRHRPYCWNVCRPIFHSNLRFMCDKAFMNEWINTFEWIPLFATTSAERKKKIYKNYTREDTNTAKKGTNRTTVGRAVPKIWSRTDKYTHTRTHRHAHHNTPLPHRGGI